MDPIQSKNGKIMTFTELQASGKRGKIVAGLYFSSALQRGGGSVVQLEKAKTRAKGRKKRRANEIGLRILRIRDFKVQIMKQDR